VRSAPFWHPELDELPRPDSMVGFSMAEAMKPLLK
jgi:hypothetical protein